MEKEGLRRRGNSGQGKGGEGKNDVSSHLGEPKESSYSEQQLQGAWSRLGGLGRNKAFLCLLLPRIVAALTCPISDCDESYNYWEPAHFLLEGSGFQTWEYAPQYALRSYAYILLHIPHAVVIMNLYPVLLGWSGLSSSLAVPTAKILCFYLIRVNLSLFSAYAEASLYNALSDRLSREGRGRGAAGCLLLLLSTSSAMYISSAAFLPSAFAMSLVTLASAALLSIGSGVRTTIGPHGMSVACRDEDNMRSTIGFMVAAVLMAWPFVGLLALPMALALLRRFSLARLVLVTLEWILVIGIPLTVIDSVFYGRLVLAPINIAAYNVFGGEGGGSQLYGTEPWYFYLANCVINFNTLLPFFLLLPLLLPFVNTTVVKGAAPIWVTLAPAYLWVAFLSLQPHKEERFLFTVYPLILASAAMSFDMLFSFLSFFSSPSSLLRSLLHASFLCALSLSLVLSCARSATVATGFSAPFSVWSEVRRQASLYRVKSGLLEAPVTVCVGKEWYRFPSSFLLPDASSHLGKAQPRFIKSGFDGQLPGLYSPARTRWGTEAAELIIDTTGATRAERPDFNSQNEEVLSRYVPEKDCHFIVDMVVEGQSEARYDLQSGWEIVLEEPFLDTGRSRFPWKTFYVPLMSQRRNHYNRYLLLRNVDTMVKR